MNQFEKETKNIYNIIKNRIKNRLNEFKNTWEKSDDYGIFVEMTFCLLTPQSKAVKCWECVQKLDNKGLLLSSDAETLADEIKGYARFHNTKAKRIVELREKLTDDNGKLTAKKTLERFKDPLEKREWLVKNVKGYGYKEAGHLLRNLGFGSNLAILDRHIYKNLLLLKVIDEIPKSVNTKQYLEIEGKMREYSKKIKIPMDHLDFTLWYKEAGDVFK